MLSFSFTPFPVISTKRLVLRQLQESDDSDLLFLRSDESVNRYISGGRLHSIEEAQRLITKLNTGIASNEWIFWMMINNDTHTMAGTICLWNIDKAQHKAETGYALHPAAEGKGLMQEALTAIIAYGFDTMGLQAIEAHTQQDNARSIALLMRNQFTKHEIADSDMNVVFSLIKE